jgi:NitT/TauT family transport system permease protein
MLSLADRFAPSLALILVVALWELACRFLNVPAYLLPSPSQIVMALGDVSARTWLENIWATLRVVLMGFAISFAISIPLAIMIVKSRLLLRTVSPLLVIIQSTPIVAVAPIIVVTLGADTLPRVVITCMITFFPLVVSTSTGLRATPDELIRLSRSLQAPMSRQFLQIRLPYAVPYILSGAKVAVTLAVIGAVVAEFVAANQGLGYMILYATSLFKLPQAFVALLILLCISLGLYQLVLAIERRFFWWSIPQNAR